MALKIPAILGLVFVAGCSAAPGGNGGKGTDPSSFAIQHPQLPLATMVSWDATDLGESDEQHHPSLALTPDGGIVIAWDDTPYEGDHRARARVFESDGAPRTDPLTLVSVPVAPLRPEVVASDRGFYTAINGLENVFVGEYDSYGQELLDEQQLNQSLGEVPNMGQPDLAVLEHSLVCVWRFDYFEAPSTRYFARFVDDRPRGAEFLLGTAYHNGSPPDVAPLPGGGFAAAWSQGVDETTQIAVGRFDRDGSPIGRPALVGDTDQLDPPGRPSIATDDAGNIAVAWRHGHPPLSGNGVWVQFYGPTGAPLRQSAAQLGSALANRVVLTVVNQIALVAYEDEGQVWVQPFSTLTGRDMYGPVVVEDSPFAQERPAIAAATIGDQIEIVVGWEQRQDDGRRNIRLATIGILPSER